MLTDKLELGKQFPGEPRNAHPVKRDSIIDHRQNSVMDVMGSHITVLLASKNPRMVFSIYAKSAEAMTMTPNQAK